MNIVALIALYIIYFIYLYLPYENWKGYVVGKYRKEERL